jgi:hypothetical protein
MRVFAILVTVLSCVLPSSLAARTRPQPVATLDLNQFFPSAPTKKPRGGHIAFLPDSTIATAACKSGNCLLVVAKWEGGTLLPFGQVTAFLEQAVIYQTALGSKLTFQDWENWHSANLYSPGPPARQDLATPQRASSSGSTVAEANLGNWTLYHFNPQAEPELELIRQAGRNLEALSDAVAVFHDDDEIRTESLQGKVLGSFKAKGYRELELGNGDKLLLHDDQGFRVVDFNGTEQLRLRAPRGSGPYVFFALSADGKRVLSDTFGRTATAPVGWAHIAAATIALGVDWAPTRERIQVMDTATGNSCFELRRSFAEGSENGTHNAALSPSGEFLATAVEGVLSVYRLPADCGPKQ